MKVYKITCFSKCSSYFAAYLQSLTIIAANPEHAKELAKEWQRNNWSFIYPEDAWEVSQISNNLDSGVIDYDVNSDY